MSILMICVSVVALVCFMCGINPLVVAWYTLAIMAVVVCRLYLMAWEWAFPSRREDKTPWLPVRYRPMCGHKPRDGARFCHVCGTGTYVGGRIDLKA